MKNLKTKSNIKFCIIFMTMLSGISQISYTFFSSTITSNTAPLTQQQFDAQLAALQSLEKSPSFKALAEQAIRELTQRWKKQNQAIPAATPAQKPKQVATPQDQADIPNSPW